jgi:hypothetical protein
MNCNGGWKYRTNTSFGPKVFNKKLQHRVDVGVRFVVE